MDDIVDACIAKARASQQRLVLPEGGDDRIVAAARRLLDERIALPILLGTRAEIDAAAARAGVSLAGLDTVDPQESAR
ncbi:MAG: phosphate acyltransferase, partial [Betaproteobacteria bacterium]